MSARFSPSAVSAQISASRRKYRRVQSGQLPSGAGGAVSPAVGYIVGAGTNGGA
jgi:hypothetical protein